MPRNRQIKADFWSDEKIGKLSAKARLFFIATWNFADDSGVCRANPVYLKNQIFPYDEAVNVQGLLSECSQQGLIRLLEYNKEQYLEIMNFLKHQKINRPSNFRYIKDLNKESMTPHSRLSDGSLLNVNVNVNENGNGNEGTTKTLTPLQLLWNEECTNLNKVIESSDERKERECLRLQERPLAVWKDVFAIINKSMFCRGENDRSWTADYDWIIKSKEYAIRALEGKYDDGNVDWMGEP